MDCPWRQSEDSIRHDASADGSPVPNPLPVTSHLSVRSMVHRGPGLRRARALYGQHNTAEYSWTV